MNRNSISGVSRALIAAVMLATAALSGCATVGDESFLYSGNDIHAQDRRRNAREDITGRKRPASYKSGLTSRVKFWVNSCTNGRLRH